MTKSDIKNVEDIKKLVDTFYATVVKDKDIGHIFSEHLDGKWQEHHEKLYRFWQTVVLKKMTYYGQPFPLHFGMNLNKSDFDTWNRVWSAVVDELFEGPKAERAKLRGRTMSDVFLSKISKNELS